MASYLKSKNGKMQIRVDDDSLTTISLVKRGKHHQVINNHADFNKLSVVGFMRLTARMVPSTEEEYNLLVTKCSEHTLSCISSPEKTIQQ